MNFTGKSIRQAISLTMGQFKNAGIENAGLDARVLVGYALNKTPEQLIRDDQELVSCKDGNKLLSFIERRVKGESPARICGYREFWSMDFLLNKATLEPRPDSEILVEVAIEHLKLSQIQSPKIIDIGTGTGCLLIALLSEIENASGIGVDIEHDALICAKENAVRHGIVDRAQFVQADLLNAISSDADLIISNPPYIPSDDISYLAPTVKLYDPKLALDGGKGGLTIYQQMADELQRFQMQRKTVILEIGFGQAEQVTEIFEALKGLSLKNQVKDLSGVTRVLVFSA